LSYPSAIRLFVYGAVLSWVPCAAQQLSISGTVRDAGGVVPEANVSLRGPNSQKVATDSSGHYSFTGLSVGRYELTFEYKGFSTLTQSVTLSAGEAKPVDVLLSVA
jgi:Carboxypeptidase regulatory-like domain